MLYEDGGEVREDLTVTTVYFDGIQGLACPAPTGEIGAVSATRQLWQAKARALIDGVKRGQGGRPSPAVLREAAYALACGATRIGWNSNTKRTLIADLKFIQSVMGEPQDEKQDQRVGRWLKVVGLLPAREHACLIPSATPSAPSPHVATPSAASRVAPQIALPVRRPDPPSGRRVRDRGQQSASLSPQSTDSVAPETDQRAQKASPASAGDPFRDVIPLPIPQRIWAAMQGKSWRRGLGCPRRGQLRYLRIPHWDFEGRTVVGEMIVARDVADDVLRAFAEIYRAQFAI
ncbi:MAG: hypothetical protein AAFY53_14900, partial [Pseudomonadota bacterium]